MLKALVEAGHVEIDEIVKFRVNKMIGKPL